MRRWRTASTSSVPPRCFFFQEQPRLCCLISLVDPLPLRAFAISSVSVIFSSTHHPEKWLQGLRSRAISWKRDTSALHPI